MSQIKKCPKFKNFSNSKKCFISDSQYAQLIGQVEESVCKHNLILFLLAHSEEDRFDLVSKLGNIIDELNFDFDKLYLIDNGQLDFLYHSHNFVNNKFPEGNIEYFYPETGLNTQSSEGRRYAGKVLPVEFINSRIIPFRVTESENKSL